MHQIFSAAYGLHDRDELTRLALDTGHTDIAFITGAPIHSTSVEHLHAFRKALAPTGLVESANTDPSFPVSGKRIHLGLGPWRDACPARRPTHRVIAANSRIALGVLHACRDLDVSVPEQLSLVAHGTPEWYVAFNPAITCFATLLAQIGHAAATAILHRIEDPQAADTDAPSVTRLHGTTHSRASLQRPIR